MQPPPPELTQSIPQGLTNHFDMVERALLALPIATVLGAALAFRPRRRGTPPRSAPVIETQIVLAIVGATVMLVVGSSLARAFGIVGAPSAVSREVRAAHRGTEGTGLRHRASAPHADRSDCERDPGAGQERRYGSRLGREEDQKMINHEEHDEHEAKKSSCPSRLRGFIPDSYRTAAPLRSPAPAAAASLPVGHPWTRT